RGLVQARLVAEVGHLARQVHAELAGLHGALVLAAQRLAGAVVGFLLLFGVVQRLALGAFAVALEVLVGIGAAMLLDVAGLVRVALGELLDRDRSGLRAARIGLQTRRHRRTAAGVLRDGPAGTGDPRDGAVRPGQ